MSQFTPHTLWTATKCADYVEVQEVTPAMQRQFEEALKNSKETIDRKVKVFG